MADEEFELWSKIFGLAQLVAIVAYLWVRTA